jgi:hypothetical protein
MDANLLNEDQYKKIIRNLIKIAVNTIDVDKINLNLEEFTKLVFDLIDKKSYNLHQRLENNFPNINLGDLSEIMDSIGRLEIYNFNKSRTDPSFSFGNDAKYLEYIIEKYINLCINFLRELLDKNNSKEILRFEISSLNSSIKILVSYINVIFTNPNVQKTKIYDFNADIGKRINIDNSIDIILGKSLEYRQTVEGHDKYIDVSDENKAFKDNLISFASKIGSGDIKDVIDPEYIGTISKIGKLFKGENINDLKSDKKQKIKDDKLNVKFANKLDPTDLEEKAVLVKKISDIRKKAPDSDKYYKLMNKKNQTKKDLKKIELYEKNEKISKIGKSIDENEKKIKKELEELENLNLEEKVLVSKKFGPSDIEKKNEKLFDIRLKREITQSKLYDARESKSTLIEKSKELLGIERKKGAKFPRVPTKTVPLPKNNAQSQETNSTSLPGNIGQSQETNSTSLPGNIGQSLEAISMPLSRISGSHQTKSLPGISGSHQTKSLPGIGGSRPTKPVPLPGNNGQNLLRKKPPTRKPPPIPKKSKILEFISQPTFIIVVALIILIIIVTLGIGFFMVGALWGMATIAKNNKHVSGTSKVYMLLYGFSLGWFYVIFSIFKYGLKSVF